MKKFLLTNCVVMIALMLAYWPASVLAQRGVNRLPGIGRAKKGIDPQIGRPGRRIPTDPQMGPNGRVLNPNRQVQKQRQQWMETLGLTADQRNRLGEIRRNLDDEQISIGRRIRQARNALDRAIMSPNYNEALVRSYTEELAAAHADQIRFQSRLRLQLRNVLTNDQVIRLRQLEQDLRRQLREEKRDLDKPASERDTVPPAQNRPPNEPEADLLSLLVFSR